MKALHSYDQSQKMEGEVEYKSSDDADTPNSSADQPLTDEKDDKHEKEDEKHEGHASGKDESNCKQLKLCT